MDIILNEDVKHVGLKDELVKVKNGYGRNYLIPNGMARLATSSNLKMWEESKRQQAHKQEKIKNDAMAMSEKMKDFKLVIGAKAGTTGKIFGSITTLQVANKMKDRGFEVDRRKIIFSEDIKNLGDYKATINLHKEVSVDIDIEVIKE